MPKVSVLLSNYNGDKHLDESISSVLSQTYKDFEFIIVDEHLQIHRGKLLKIIMIKE